MNHIIYIPLANNLHIYILQYYYDHILTKKFRQNKILKLIYYRYTWLFIYMNVENFCKSYITYMRSKLQCYKPYKSLKQLLISKHLWNLISIDFKKLLFLFSFNIISVIVYKPSKQAVFCSNNRYYYFV